MPSWQWSYPYSGTDTATALFDASPASALCHWRAPFRDTPIPRQLLVETLDGGVRSYRVGQAGRIIQLEFDGLPEGSDTTAIQLWGYLGLLAFLEDSTDFSQDTFGFYDHTDTPSEVEVRYVGGSESFVLSQGRYSGQIVLREELI